MYDLVEIKKDSERCVNDLLKSPTPYWHQVGLRVFVKPDGDSGNFWLRGDHPNGEGMFYIHASDLPALSVVVKGLSEDHVERYHQSLGVVAQVEGSGSKWQKRKAG